MSIVLKIAIVLNFNNYKNTISCVRNLVKSGVDRVVIVDNASTNDSCSKLEYKFCHDSRIDLIFSTVNNGYASGNNIGLKFVEKKYGLDNIIYIVNPDVTVNRSVIDEVSTVIKKVPGSGMVTTRVNDTMNSVWKHTGLLRGFIFNLWMLNIVLYKLGITEHSIYKKEKSNIQEVEVVSGAFFGINQRIFKKVGYFDNKTFLYYEEEILSCKLRKIGCNNYIINDLNYNHAGQSSTNIPKLSSKIINDKSRLYFLKKYDGAGQIYSFLYKLTNKVDNALFKLFYKIK